MIAARDWFLEKNAGRGISSAIKLRVFSPTIISKEVGLGPMSGHGWRKYTKDESGNNSSDSYAEAFRNEGLDVEGLGGG
jgi:hypothetical protein